MILFAAKRDNWMISFHLYDFGKTHSPLIDSMCFVKLIEMCRCPALTARDAPRADMRRSDTPLNGKRLLLGVEHIQSYSTRHFQTLINPDVIHIRNKYCFHPPEFAAERSSRAFISIDYIPVCLHRINGDSLSRHISERFVWHFAIYQHYSLWVFTTKIGSQQNWKIIRIVTVCTVYVDFSIKYIFKFAQSVPVSLGLYQCWVLSVKHQYEILAIPLPMHTVAASVRIWVIYSILLLSIHSISATIWWGGEGAKRK